MFECNMSKTKAEYKKVNSKKEIINLLKKFSGEEQVNTENYEVCKKFYENMTKKKVGNSLRNRSCESSFFVFLKSLDSLEV